MSNQCNFPKRFIMWQGKRYTYLEAAEYVGISVEAFYRRAKHWDDVKDIMTVPPGQPRPGRGGRNATRKPTVFDGLTPIEALAMKWTE